jgi:hypothetical protein
MRRIEITIPFLGICHMQVCAVKDVTDEEILDVCNKENPAGTTNGWVRVIRETDGNHDEKSLPVQCTDFEDRLHFLVVC